MLLLKAEPSEFAFADLVRAGRTRWDGVTNPGARITLRSARQGEGVWLYHTGDERAIVALARVAQGAYEDPARPGLNPRGEIDFPVIDLEPGRALPSPVTLERIRADARFDDCPLVRQARLSVLRLGDALDEIVREWAGLERSPARGR